MCTFAQSGHNQIVAMSHIMLLFHLFDLFYVGVTSIILYTLRYYSIHMLCLTLRWVGLEGKEILDFVTTLYKTKASIRRDRTWSRVKKYKFQSC